MNYGWRTPSLEGFSPTNGSFTASPGSSKKKRITRVRTGCRTLEREESNVARNDPNVTIVCGQTKSVQAIHKNDSSILELGTDCLLVNPCERKQTLIESELVRGSREDTLPARTESTFSWSSTPVDAFFDLRLLQHYIQDSASMLSVQGIIGRAWAQDVPQLVFGGIQEHLISQFARCVCRPHQF